MEGFPSDRMLQAEKGPIALLMDPNFRTALIGSRLPIPCFLVEVAGIMDGAFFSV
jgi:hypothetical protein